MKNFLGVALVLSLFAGGLWGMFFFLDPDHRWQFERQFPSGNAPAAGLGETPKAREPHVRKAEADWEAIDAHAIATPRDQASDMSTLVRHLCKPAKNDWERARAIFRWIAEFMHYDDAAYNSGVYGLNDAEEALRSRKGVCDDFADLFKAMAEKAGLAAEKIGGWSKGYGYTAGTKFGQPDHAWNAVFIDDEWHLLDVTWAEGFGETKNGKLKTTKKFKGGWFDTAPAEFVFKHLPSDPKWQLLEKPLTLAEYENLPVAGPELFALGYDSAWLLAEARSGKSVEFPMVFDHPFAIKAVSVPYQKAFSLGSPLKLQFECRDCAAMAAFSDGIITDFDKKGKAFSLTFKPSPGPLRIFAKKNKNDRRFQGVMEFDIL